jgi:hypothetical protein
MPPFPGDQNGPPVSAASGSRTAAGDLPQSRPAPDDDELAALRAPWRPERETSGTWQGWAYFGAVIMALLGFFQALEGLIALVDKEYFVLRTNRLLIAHSYQAWGWLHLLLGLAAVAVGIGIIVSGHRLARVAGVIIAGLSALANLGFLQASPVWSSLVIILDIIVIYALTVHGWELDKR